MASLMRLLNRLLPFATPGTPLYQDVVHLGVVCALLYYAPQIQDWLQQRQAERENPNDQDPQPEQAPLPPQEAEGGLGREEDQNQEEAANAQNNQQDAPNPHFDAQEGDPGPANPARDVLPSHRNVGAKKAKSLARKDQRRAYNEFQRSQGDAQRARDAENAPEREAELAAERERRKAAEAKIEAQKVREREKKREVERREREEGIAKRERVVEIVREELEERRMCNLWEVARRVGGEDDVWVEKILRAGGILGTRESGDVVTIVTSTGWVVRVSKEDMMEAYDAVGAKQKKEISYDEFGEVLADVLLGR